MKSKLILGSGMVLAALSVTLMAQQSQDKPPSMDNPIAGVWRLDPEQSTFEPGPGPSEPLTRIYIDRGEEGMVSITATTNPDGIPTYGMSISRYDGTENAFYSTPELIEWLATGDTSSSVTQVYRVIDPYTTEITFSMDGEPLQQSTRTVSSDRQTLTEIKTGTNLQGQSIRQELVFEAVCGDSQFHSC